MHFRVQYTLDTLSTARILDVCTAGATCVLGVLYAAHHIPSTRRIWAFSAAHTPSTRRIEDTTYD